MVREHREPDLTYRGILPDYRADLDRYLGTDVTRPFAVDLPATSENILPWQSFADHTAAAPRWFWDWPAILDAIAPATRRYRPVSGWRRRPLKARRAGLQHRFRTAA